MKSKFVFRSPFWSLEINEKLPPTNFPLNVFQVASKFFYIQQFSLKVFDVKLITEILCQKRNDEFLEFFLSF